MFSAAAISTASAVQNVVDLQAQFVRAPTHAIHVGKTAAGASARLRISNVGDANAKGQLSALVYLSSDSTLDGGDTLVGRVVAPHAMIKGGKSKSLSAQLRFSSGTAIGDYHLIAVVDPAGTIPRNVAAGNVFLAPTTIMALGHPHHHPPDNGGVLVIGDDGSSGDDFALIDDGSDSNSSSTTQPTTSSSDSGSDFSDPGGDFSGGDDGGGDAGGGADF